MRKQSWTITSAEIVLGEVTLYIRGGSRAAATSKMERFVIIGNGFQPLTIITKRSILVVAATLDPPLTNYQASLEAYLGSCQT